MDARLAALDAWAKRRIDRIAKEYESAFWTKNGDQSHLDQLTGEARAYQALRSYIHGSQAELEGER